jgi:hypothetical protein
MRPHTLLVALSILTLVTAAAFGQTLGAVLTAAGEVPPTTSPGFGNATVTFDSTRQNISVTVTVANLGSPITAAHIHPGAAGQANNPIIGFTPSASFVNGKLTGTFPVPSATATAMLQNPSNFYVNVHTQQFPGGAIRGQLSAVSGTAIVYAADLRGSNETPPNSSTATGSAIVTIDTINNTLTWDVATKGIASPLFAHIHPGAAGVAGNPLITFAGSSSDFTNGRTNGAVSIASLDATQLNNLLTNPSAFYVNVHSSAFPGGEIRGQLTAANEYDVAVAGHVTGIGTVFVTDTRVFNPSYDTGANALLEFFAAGNGPNAIASSTITINVPARGTAVLDDVAGASGLNVTGTGAIRVTSAEQLAGTSRIYSDQRAAGKGTFGQFVPAQPRANALRRGVMAQLSNTSAANGSRTNIGFFNPNTASVTVRLELRDNAGALVGSNTLTLQALSQQQNSIGTYFPGVDLSNAQNLTLSFDASAAIDAYASVIDSTSTDPIFVPAQQDAGVAASQ